MTSTDPRVPSTMMPNTPNGRPPTTCPRGGIGRPKGIALTNGNTTAPCTAATRTDSWAKIPTELLAAVAQGQLAASALLVYGMLVRHADAAGHAHPTQGHLATDSGLGLATVKRLLRQLRQLGLVEVVGQISTRAGAANVYGVGHGKGVAGDPNSVDDVPIGVAGDPPIGVAGELQNETQATRNPYAPARDDDHQDLDDDQGEGVEQLLDALPPRIARRIRKPERLRPVLARAGRHRSMRAIVREISGDRWPPLDDARSVEAVLLTRLRELADQLDTAPASGSGCRACDAAPLQLLDDSTAIKACSDHLQITTAVAA